MSDVCRECEVEPMYGDGKLTDGRCLTCQHAVERDVELMEMDAERDRFEETMAALDLGATGIARARRCAYQHAGTDRE